MKRELEIRISSQGIEILNEIEEEGEIYSTEIKSTQKGLPLGWTRATFIINEEINEKLKALAYWERVTIKEVLNDALTGYLKNKNIKALPNKYQDLPIENCNKEEKKNISSTEITDDEKISLVKFFKTFISKEGK